MDNALRVLFLVFLFITAIIFTIRKGPALGLEDIKVIVLDFLLVPVAIGTVVVFAFIITRTDPMGLILEVSSQISGRFNVSFLEAIPPDLRDTLDVVSVNRQDTDGDGFSEWVVFYQFEQIERADHPDHFLFVCDHYSVNLVVAHDARRDARIVVLRDRIDLLRHHRTDW